VAKEISEGKKNDQGLSMQKSKDVTFKHCKYTDIIAGKHNMRIYKKQGVVIIYAYFSQA